MVFVNGKSYQGNNISIKNDVIMIDGKRVDTPDAKQIGIVVQGNAESVSLDVGSISVVGDAGSVRSSSGDINVTGAVKGSVQSSSGDVSVTSDVYGDVTTSSGDVTAQTIKGKVSTKSGDINHG